MLYFPVRLRISNYNLFVKKLKIFHRFSFQTTRNTQRRVVEETHGRVLERSVDRSIDHLVYPDHMAGSDVKNEQEGKRTFPFLLFPRPWC